MLSDEWWGQRQFLRFCGREAKELRLKTRYPSSPGLFLEVPAVSPPPVAAAEVRFSGSSGWDPDEDPQPVDHLDFVQAFSRVGLTVDTFPGMGQLVNGCP